MRKPIEKMNAGELADEFNPANTESSVRYDYATMYRLTSRLRELHDLTRWIPVSERVPTEEDAYKGQVFVFVDGQAESWPFNDLGNATHWCRITPPEDK
jgi:hypothetical protein